MAKLTPKAERIFQDICILTTRDSQDGGYVRRPAYFGGALDELSELGLIDLSMPRKVRLTDAGREYAIAHGWIAAPAVATQEQPKKEATMAKLTVGQAVTWNNPYSGKQTGVVRRIYMVRASDGSEVANYVVENDKFVTDRFDYELTPVVNEPIAAPVSADSAAAVTKTAADAPVLDAASEPTPAPFAVGQLIYTVFANGTIALQKVVSLKGSSVETDGTYIIPLERCFYTLMEAQEYRNRVVFAVKPPPPSELDLLRTENDALKTALQTALTHLLRNSPKNAEYVLQQALNK